ncbi:unnamed protein product [Somion occarium]|uniref:Uncharacterized protein n=1 Tax=Somion occarium TaxID=3059160 RepID=A0ABP1D419_9APHY
MPVSFSEHPRASTARLVRSNSSKHARGGSLGLIDAARVRFTKDLPSLLRASSKSRHPKSRLSSQVQVSEIDISVHSDYAKRYRPDPTHSVIDPMDNPIVNNERQGRSLGSRIVNFLSRSRSRSRSKKRRSRSLDVPPVTDLPVLPVKTGSFGRHTRHSGLQDEEPSPSTSTSKPSTRSQSRPLSSTTTATDTTIKPRQKDKDLPAIPPKRSYTHANPTHLLAPQPRPSAMVHILNSPPFPRGEYARDGVDAPDSGDYGGRCSPLCLPPRFTPPGARNKGKEKERERERASKGRERDGSRDTAKDKDRDRITAPRRVGSPILRERERESRSAIGTVPMEKVASGSGNSRRSSGRESVAANAISVSKVKRTKHGSFDFERPISSPKVDGNFSVKTALRGMGIGAETRAPSAIPMMRSTSLKATPRSPSGYGNGHAKSSSGGAGAKPRPAPDSLGRTKKPQLDVHTTSSSKPSRRGTNDSGGGSSHASHSAPGPRIHFTPSDADPASPTSSQSGHSSSWGKSGGKQILRSSHGAFKFEPAVPMIPGSPASDERKSAARGGPGPSNLSNPPTPTKALPQRPSTKGRSLDLGLGLSWAPSRVREEAMLPRSHVGVSASTSKARARYRGTWVDQDARHEFGVGSRAEPIGSEVAHAFKDALGDAAYSIFKMFVHRFDAHAIPLEGPYGLIYHAHRLLDEANTLDERNKQLLMDNMFPLLIVLHLSSSSCRFTVVF